MSEFNTTDSSGFGKPNKQYKLFIEQLQFEVELELIGISELIDDVDSDWIAFAFQSDQEEE